MARCRCGTDKCTCHLMAGSYTTVRGDGSQNNPWQVDVIPVSTGTILFQDGATINFANSGVGSQASPYVITAEAEIGGLIEIEGTSNDINVVKTGTGSLASPLHYAIDIPYIDTGGAGGTPGDVLIRRADGVFAPGAGASVPVGTIYVKTGLMGDGSIANPLGLDLCTYGDVKSPRVCSRAAAKAGQTYPPTEGVTGETYVSATALTQAGFVPVPVSKWVAGTFLTVGGYRFHWGGTGWQPGLAV